MHFQGYVAAVCNKTVVHVHSLRNNNSKNATSKAIATTLFDDENINFKSYFKRRVQLDSNNCGVWLVAGIASYAHRLPLPSGLDDAFDIAYSPLGLKRRFQLIRPYLHRQIGKAKIISIFFDCTFLISCFDGRSISF